MKLIELVDAFKQKYALECFKRGTAAKMFGDKIIALLLSEAVGDIQKTFGVIELSTDIPIVARTDKYALTSSYMDVTKVKFGDVVLDKRSKSWMEDRIASSGSPTDFTIVYDSAIPKIWVYPNPSTNGMLVISYIPNLNFYSPSSTLAGDFGDLDIAENGFSGDTVFPTQYDKLMLLGLLKQLFNDLQTEYDREKSLLVVKQFNAEKFDYDSDWGGL